MYDYIETEQLQHVRIRTVRPFRRATVFLHRHRELTGVRVEGRRRRGRGWRGRVHRARTPRRPGDPRVPASWHTVKGLR